MARRKVGSVVSPVLAFPSVSSGLRVERVEPNAIVDVGRVPPLGRLVVLSIVGAPFAYRFSRWMIVLRMKRGNLR
jgi:hypothetical protein